MIAEVVCRYTVATMCPSLNPSGEFVKKPGSSSVQRDEHGMPVPEFLQMVSDNGDAEHAIIGL